MHSNPSGFQSSLTTDHFSVAQMYWTSGLITPSRSCVQAQRRPLTNVLLYRTVRKTQGQPQDLEGRTADAGMRRWTCSSW
jgi:hypothetical protein